MKTVYNLYLKNSKNTGDVACSPCLYFKFPFDIVPVNMAGWEKNNLDGSIVIVGGGGLFHSPSPVGEMEYFNNLVDICDTVIVWGAGHNINGTRYGYYPTGLDMCDCIGVRDYNMGYRFVPCPSCMSGLFDKDYSVENETVIYEHVASPISGYSHKKKNNTVPFDEAISFLASAETIISNSYHGLYWGMLLNKKVILANNVDNSSRFCGMPPDGFNLKTCRTINLKFHDIVIKEINNRLNRKQN